MSDTIPDASPRIVSRRAATLAEWETFSRSCGHATFFHTPHWAAVFCDTRNDRMKRAARMVEFSDGRRALLPLSRKVFARGVLSMYWSSPATTYGGWLYQEPLDSAHCRLLTAELCSLPDVVWRENPFEPHLPGQDIPGAVDDFTQVIDLRGGIEAAVARSDYSHRRAVRKAVEKKVAVAEASNVEDWMSYFSLYETSRERWKDRGLPRSRCYSLDFFRTLFECPTACRKLWLAMLDGKPIAGTVCFYWNAHAVSWSSAGRGDLFHEYRPNDLLYDRMIRHAAENGFQWFDCNPSAGLAGVVDFKQHIGAQRMKSRVFHNRSPLLRCATALRKAISR